MQLNMDKDPTSLEEALYQALVMRLLPDQWSDDEKTELDDSINKLQRLLPEKVVNTLKMKAMAKFFGINVGEE
tara:strand:+ start:287 stop:505 length:219 start_codon:yes stop_codon:yes gene_type:complete